MNLISAPFNTIKGHNKTNNSQKKGMSIIFLFDIFML